MYSRQPNVRTVVDTIAREAAELRLKMYEKVPRSGSLPSGRLELGDHRAIELLNNPTEGESTYRFWFSLFADIGIYDRAFWGKVRSRGPGTPPDALIRIPPAALVPELDPVTNRIRRWRTTDGSVVEASDLVVFWGYDPTSNQSAISPMETLRRLLAEEWAAGNNREGFWTNAARKEGIIEQDVDALKMSDEARESFLLDIEDALAGSANSGRPLMLEPGMKWKDFVWSPREAEYIDGRKLNRTEVAAAYHMPPAMVAASQDDSEPDAETLHFFYTSTLPPYLSRVEAEIKAQLLPEFDLLPSIRKRRYFEFNLDAKLRGSFEQQAAIMATTAGGPVVTVNEARARLNLPPIDSGDEIFVPLNSVRAGGPQASPQNPVETPTDDIEPAGTTPGGGTASIESVMLKFEERMADRKNRAEHEAFMREQRARYAERGANTFQKFFARQRNGVAGGRFNKSRWDRELTDDLFGLAYQTVEIFGEDAAKRMGGRWDQVRTANFLRANCENAAKAINASTAERLEADDPDLDTIFSDARAAKLGADRTTFAMNWAIMEAAHQNGEV